MRMGNRCYEWTDEPWDRVRDLMPQSRMGHSRKDDRLMVNAMLWLARSGAGSRKGMGYGKWYTVDFANGVMREPFWAYLRP